MTLIEPSGEITFGGSWAPNDAFDAIATAFGGPTRTVTIVPESVRVFGVEWWATRFAFEARVAVASDDGADDVVSYSASIQPIGPITQELAEWWRRIGFHVLKYPAHWWRTVSEVAL